MCFLSDFVFLNFRRLVALLAPSSRQHSEKLSRSETRAVSPCTLSLEFEPLNLRLPLNAITSHRDKVQ